MVLTLFHFYKTLIILLFEKNGPILLLTVLACVCYSVLVEVYTVLCML